MLPRNQLIGPQAHAALIAACGHFLLKRTQMRADSLKDLICREFDSHHIGDVDSSNCLTMYNAIRYLLEFYEAQLPQADSEKLFKARVALCDRAANFYANDIVLVRKHWIDELDDLSNNEEFFENISGYNAQISHCLDMFRASFTNNNAKLMISLPTMAMLRHATGAGEYERSERMTAAMKGISTHVEGIRLVDASDVSDSDYEAMASLLEDEEKLESHAPTDKYDVIDQSEDTYVNDYSHQAVKETIKHIIKTTRDAIQLQMNGLCIIRPPGHHASRESAEGFCLRNNVIYGAHAAKDVLEAGKGILIVDIDIHSGNGTIDYVKRWEDARHAIQFVEMYNPDIYPCIPTDKHEADHPSLHRIKIRSGKKAGNYGEQLVHDIFEKIKAVDHNMGVVFISLGLDGHEHDSEIGKSHLTDGFYIQLFEKLRSYFSKKQIPIVAVLEGGYNLSLIERLMGEYVKAFHRETPSPMLVVKNKETIVPEKKNLTTQDNQAKKILSLRDPSKAGFFAVRTMIQTYNHRINNASVGKVRGSRKKF